MTRASAVYEHDYMFRSPSDRIGSYMSPHAMALTKVVLKERLGGSSFSSPATAAKVVWPDYLAQHSCP